MTGLISICNMALGLVPTRSTIASLTEGSSEANALNLIYMPVLRSVMRQANWNFAKGQVVLSQLGSAATGNALVPWGYKYAYPSDCLKIRFLLPTYQMPLQASIPTQLWMGPPILFEEASDFDVNGNAIKVISTNQAQATAVYTRLVTDTTVWDDQFVIAFSNALAARVGLTLSGDKDSVAACNKLAMETIREAQVTDGNEGLTIQEHVPDWMRVRGYASDYAYPNGGCFGYVNFVG